MTYQTMSLLKTYKYNNVSYSSELDFKNQTIEFSVDNPRKNIRPESVYKYFSFNKLSLDAFINHYLFSSHPMKLNDKYDCAGDLIDYSNLNLDIFIHHLSKELGLFTEDKIADLFNSGNKWVLDRSTADLYHIRLFMKFGLISFTEDPKNTLMWAHYAQNSGFVLKMKVALLPKDFFGPFPINYCEKLNKIDFSKYDPSLCILYLSNVKQKVWEYENEWRYLTYNKEGKYHPFYSNSDLKSRKFYYNPDAIEEIILGYDFFNLKEIDFNKRTPDYDIIIFSNKKSKENRKLKRKFLDFIVRNAIPSYQVIRNRFSYLLDVKEIKIEKISTNKFKVFNSFKQTYD